MLSGVAGTDDGVPVPPNEGSDIDVGGAVVEVVTADVPDVHVYIQLGKEGGCRCRGGRETMSMRETLHSEEDGEEHSVVATPRLHGELHKRSPMYRSFSPRGYSEAEGACYNCVKTIDPNREAGKTREFEFKRPR